MKNQVVFVSGIFVLGFWLVGPILQHFDGTSRGISVEVITAPFVDSEVLNYSWSGDVYRSCETTLRRSITDSEGVVTQLEPKSFDPLPRSDLGPLTYDLQIHVPERIPSGPATYNVTEVPRCDWLQRVFPVGVDYPPVTFMVTRGDSK